VRALAPFFAVSTLVLLAFAPSCKTATVIRAHYTTDLACQNERLGQKVMFSLARSGEPAVFDGRDPSDAERCIPGARATVGDAQGLVLRPNDTADPPYDGSYELVAIVGTEGTTAAACNLGPEGKPTGALGGAKCIVARRKVRFVAGAEVKQNVYLSSQCAGVVCPDGRTCNPATRLCAEVAENVEGENRGDPTTPETDGGAPPLDASPPPIDATVDGATDLPVCSVFAPNNACGGTVSLGAFAPLAGPKVVAGFGRAAWISPATNTISEAVFTNGNAVTTPLPALSLLPHRLAYANVGGAPRLAAAFSNPVNESGDTVQLWNGTGWAAIATAFDGQIAALVSDGTFLGGWVGGAKRESVVPFEIDSATTAAIHPETAANLAIEPFVGGASAGEHRLVWAHGSTAYSIGNGDKGASPHVNKLPASPSFARLVAVYSGNHHLVGVTTTGDLVGIQDGIAAGTPYAYPIVPSVVDATADAAYLYAVRTSPVTNRNEIVAVKKSALPNVDMCRLTNASVFNGNAQIRAIAVDDTCVYVTAAPDRASGAPFTLSRLPRAR